ncbi:DUF1998 domain-containing protein [Paenibacillus barengoltzii]|uniref:MrfA-like Zn-binding domain-containing protein n=1 Tax=Paenibacillus barengoltzii J12 TaxID=935846 RepID=A0ABY1LYG1_9BACL|nr:DUF1998 domain-containing protein [Paenibacillus barengoltzii]SMF33583.1 protein of unknown function [Paenibacillus barengoltzii J12]
MRLKVQNRNSKRVVGNARQTQLITTFGCGSIVDLPNDSVIIAGTDYWTHYTNEKYIVHEANLEKLLKVDYFLKPKDEEQRENPYIKSRDVPVFRFPETMICTKCGKIDNYRNMKFNNIFKCRNCGGKQLIPSRFVVACENGHLDDFPYAWWVHRGDFSKCSEPEKHLFMIFSKDTGGLDSIVIECRNCHGTNPSQPLRRNMQGSFSENALAGWNGGNCSRRRPWLRDQDTRPCDKRMRTTQRGASNLYFANHSSALSIPPWSSQIQEELNKRDSFLRMLRGINPDDQAMLNNLLMFLPSQGIHEVCNCSIEDVKEQIMIWLRNQNNEREINEHILLEDEYRAFLEGNRDDPLFSIRKGEVPDFLANHIDTIVLAHKLREVVALTGFNRIKPNDGKDKFDNRNIRKNPSNWLPGIEMFGEGIFIKLNEQKLADWEVKYQKRFDIINRHSRNSLIQTDKLSPRYILLHSLSHLLIRQLVFQCGYSSSSIKEKIYSTYVSDDNPLPMAGILIYTTTPDSEGSLGGLVNEGRSERFKNTVKNMLEAASWCSSDPLCIHSNGQGLDSLNLAACHSCGLLPETSCEIRNSYLDRAAVIGTLDHREIGYFFDL